MNTIVRKAFEADLPQYITLAEAFHEASPMRGVIEFDRDGYSQFYMGAIHKEDVGIWLAEIDDKIVGISAAVSYPMYFNPSTIVVQELWWWLTPDSRGSGVGGMMFKQIERWAEEHKASALFMIALEDARARKMENLYIRAGFKPMERTFIKEITSWR
jgi:GNAT superfamily N-acetyltransferase